MHTRHARLLAGLIQEHIRTAEPVGSLQLARKLEVALSPATIRSILRDLDEAGFLYQPHTSAGRLPTDQGYRYYLDHEQATTLNAEQLERMHKQLIHMQQEYRQFARATAKLLAQLSQSVAVSGSAEGGDIHEAGLPAILQQPETERFEAVREISQLLEYVDTSLDELLEGDGDETAVYIGEENPYLPAQHTSMVVRTVSTRRRGKVALVVVGVKRMSYQHNISVVNALADIIQKHNL